jgi:hypothetical protein
MDRWQRTIVALAVAAPFGFLGCMTGTGDEGGESANLESEGDALSAQAIRCPAGFVRTPGSNRICIAANAFVPARADGRCPGEFELVPALQGCILARTTTRMLRGRCPPGGVPLPGSNLCIPNTKIMHCWSGALPGEQYCTHGWPRGR